MLEPRTASTEGSADRPLTQTAKYMHWTSSFLLIQSFSEQRMNPVDFRPTSQLVVIHLVIQSSLNLVLPSGHFDPIQYLKTKMNVSNILVHDQNTYNVIHIRINFICLLLINTF